MWPIRNLKTLKVPYDKKFQKDISQLAVSLRKNSNYISKVALRTAQGRRAIFSPFKRVNKFIGKDSIRILAC